MNISITKIDTAVIKGIAILAMLMHHVFEPLTGQSWVVDQLQGLGKVCVALFVLLSGYGMAVGYMRITPPPQESEHSQGASSLLLRRLLKFYMNYWAVFLIFVPLGVLVFGRPLNAAYPAHLNVYRSLIIDILGLGGFHSYNITWWFNRLILVLYIISPALFFFVKEHPIISLGAVFCLIMLGVLPHNISLNYCLLPFMMGMAWALHADKLNKIIDEVKYNRILLILVAIIAVAVLSWMRLTKFMGFNGVFWDMFLATAITLLVVLLNPCFKYTRGALGFLGKHSMNIYMIHTFVFAYFWKDEVYALGNPWLILLVVLAISLIISIIIEFVKDKICFYQVLDRLMEKLEN